MATSLLTASIFLIGQYVDMPAIQKTFWRGLVPFIALTPILPFLEWPAQPLFYVATLTTALIVSYSDTQNFAAASKFGAGVAIRMKPFIIWLVFLVWFILDSDTRSDLLSQPLVFSSVLVCLLIGALSASFMNRCPISRSALIFYLPIIGLGACVDILNKTAMDSSGFMSGVIIYAWMQALVISIVTFLIQKRTAAASPSGHTIISNLKIGGIIGCIFLCANLCKNTAMSLTLNPSYVTAIVFTSPVWVSLYYKYIQHKEPVNIWAGYGLILSAIGLILCTTY
ncbi:MAG: hypothetical protein VYC19_10230 [Pseudomonadota bacterium]|jgi:hypothetical protein|nr:hypothetical protein [Alphaproteobacteria bacterium]MCS5595679.1 hypothetical protein [Alphaproteobacteria bacterium]MEC7703122.1 hypothetical protein [Pseudomonadota bacterium]